LLVVILRRSGDVKNSSSRDLANGHL